MFTQLSNCSHNFRLCATLSVFDDRKMEKALDVMQILGQLGYSTRCNSRLCFGITFVKCFFFCVTFFLIKNKIDSVVMQIILQSYVVGDNISDMLINSTNVA